MLQFIVASMRAGIRGRSFHAVLVLGVLLVGVAYLAGYFSPRQPQTVAMDVGFSCLRFSLVLLSLFWIQDMVGREIDRRTVVFALAYPVPRSTYLLGRYLGIVSLAMLAALVLGLLLGIAIALAGGGYEQEFPVRLGLAYWATIFAIWLDVALVTAFSLWIASLSTVPVLPLALGAAFAIAGKSLGPVMEFLTTGAGGDAEMASRFGPVVNAIRWIVPDLSRLDWRPWPMYGLMPESAMIFWSLAMSIGYILLILSVAIRVFTRREFV